jgi:pimeloyl-ACP methyl ester carboxylesterase
MPLPESWPRYEFTGPLLARGYAVASVGYRRQGWALAEGVDDTESLRQWFVSRYGQPRRTFMIGSSMGGLVTIASQESVPDGYDGALALCGAVAPTSEGARDRVLALLVAFDYFFPGHMGVAPQGLAAEDAPPDLPEAELERALAGDPDKAELLARRFEIRREDLAGHVRFYYVMLRELVARSGGFPVDNRALEYAGFGDDAAFNRGVRRYAAGPEPIEYLRQHYTPSGRLAHPVLLLGTSYDPTVPAEAADRYLELARAAGNESLVLSRRVPGEGHCRFEADQVGSAFDELVAWVESGHRPVDPSTRTADTVAPAVRAPAPRGGKR